MGIEISRGVAPGFSTGKVKAVKLVGVGVPNLGVVLSENELLNICRCGKQGGEGAGGFVGGVSDNPHFCSFGEVKEIGIFLVLDFTKILGVASSRDISSKDLTCSQITR